MEEAEAKGRSPGSSIIVPRTSTSSDDDDDDDDELKDRKKDEKASQGSSFVLWRLLPGMPKKAFAGTSTTPSANDDNDEEKMFPGILRNTSKKTENKRIKKIKKEKN